ncbi:DUF1205 domain-containing protein [Frankia sp. AiPs1]|uniref:nucleotide disphospho-sugar-binding domain-containing protein n=1 Tax=Frankia sp. AiPs1 TaxID=573493 RepID=UPI002042C3EB|nr:nucleotide disphospho-sugar-binding domain-containing protein [Frankia sp. AiPs1]MCM3921335.1 DUF1205 domain-containing protein [Frankia sp. AiPs1]
MLVVTCPLTGHFLPMVSSTWALSLAGHEVRVAASPAFTGLVHASGLLAVPSGPDAPDGLIQAVPAASRRGTGPGAKLLQSSDWFAAVATGMTDDLVAFCRGWRPDVLMHDPLALAAPLVSTLLGIPRVEHRWGVDVSDTLVAPAAAAFASTARRHGVAEEPDPPAMIIDPCPPRLQLPDAAPGLRVRYQPYNGGGTVPAWAWEAPTAPRVCITPGTVVDPDKPLPWLGELADGLSRLEVEVLVAIRAEHRDAAGALPPGVRTVESVPLGALLPHCDLVVHHGGSGTGMSAAAHGTP